MASWEHAIAERLRLLGLDSIRRRILAFGVMATLIPSLITGTISYAENYRVLSEKTADQLRNASFQGAREVDLFFKDRLFDLRVFSNSYEVSENLQRLGPSRSGPGGPSARRLTEYLTAVKLHATDFEEVMVLDRQGRVLASSAAKPGPVELPDGWARDVWNGHPVVGEPYWDTGLNKPAIICVVPILRDDVTLGAVSGKVTLEAVATILRRFAPGETGEAALLSSQGQFIITSNSSSKELMQSRLAEDANQSLASRLGNPVEFTGPGGRMLGTLQQVPRVGGNVVASMPISEAFQQVNRLRNTTILMVLGILVLVGGLAYILALVIIRPLERLREGAEQVAGGNLDVSLPVTGGGEVSYLTEHFNDMVRGLRESRAELERLSNTDGLTGLVNRRRLMEALGTEVERATRMKHPCAVLMVDVDHFKQFNDSYGHPAGDAVLARVAAILRESIRSIDVAGRYGGEEFLLVLTETTMSGALEVAERIRTKLTTEVFDGGRITVSVGAAEFPDGGRSAEALIMSADLALYQAKKEGRDRVVQAPAEAARQQS